MNESGFELDTRDFDMDFSKIAQGMIPEKVEKALWQLGWVIIKHANTVEPTTPKKSGDLRGSGTVVVEDQVILLVGFNMIYARKMHEGLKDWNWSEPGSGPKYLESKLPMFKKKYMKFVADRVKP